MTSEDIEVKQSHGSIDWEPILLGQEDQKHPPKVVQETHSDEEEDYEQDFESERIQASQSKQSNLDELASCPEDASIEDKDLFAEELAEELMA